MVDAAKADRPAWQTDELEDEWIDQESEEDQLEPTTISTHDHSSSDLSLTQPLGSVVVRHSDSWDSSPSTDPGSVGTVLVREDIPAAPLLPKTPGRNNKAFVKDFFSPLPLERMFEPPSPPLNNPIPLPQGQSSIPIVPSRLSQVYVAGEDDTEILGNTADEYGEEEYPSTPDASGQSADVANCQFTFELPRAGSFNQAGMVPQAQSTPGPPTLHASAINPSTDPRLRLFQFQYDTFTREHLSAMVDSIAVNTPSGGSGTAHIGEEPSPSSLSPVREASTSRLRSAKRIKLSPASDFSGGGDGAALIYRPQTLRKDYVGESKFLMEKIRQTRDFSTISTTATAQSPAHNVGTASASHTPHPPLSSDPPLLTQDDAAASRLSSSNWTVASSKRGIYSSLGYREQAANLMAQIRSDMKGAKRIFSGDTEASRLAAGDRNDGYVTETTMEESAAMSRNIFHEKGNVPENLFSSARVQKGPSSSSQGTSHKFFEQRNIADETDQDLTDKLADMSLDSQRLLEQFPDPPVVLTVTKDVVAADAEGICLPHEPNPTLLVPPTGNAPAYPSSSLRSGRNEDLTRFVSSSTASGTTLTAGSAASFVKHPGPKQITRITPEDVPALPDRVGKMVFDKVMMRWVKATAVATVELHEEDEPELPACGNDSEDPFRDIESLREDDPTRELDAPNVIVERDGDDESDDNFAEDHKSRIEEIEEDIEDEEEAELTSFSFDGASAEMAQMALEDAEHNELDMTDSEDSEDETGTIEPSVDMNIPSDDSDEGYEGALHNNHGPEREPALHDSPPHLLAPPQYTVTLATPHPARASSISVTTPTVRSALKSNSITPVSALKDPNRSRNYTPANRLGHRRSVSFSDGKRDGPIVGIGRNAPTPDGEELDGVSPLANGSTGTSAALISSARSKRIADMLNNLEDSVFDEESPSKTSSSGRPPTEELQPLKPRRPSSHPGRGGATSQEVSRRVFSRSHSMRSAKSPGRSANATFLTECSFGVAHDRLVQVITDVEPFEPYWDSLTAIDLSKHHLDSVSRMKELLPHLDSLSLNENRLAWLSGIPGTVRSLSVTSNILTGLTSYSHLLSLENLDISRNQIESLRQLDCLRHLRELRADGNKIDSTDGLLNMDGLVKLSLQGNVIRNLDVRQYRWTRLEMLNLSHNRLTKVEGLESLTALIALNLDNNVLSDLDPGATLPRLRILRVSGNQLQQLHAAPFPNLRTLYADNNSLGTIHKAYRLTKLENLSLRNQNARAGLSLSVREVRDVKRLYLSGNPLKAGFISEPCYNLIYLELAACRLTALPPDFARMMPNVRVLNLNYNFLEDVRPLEGLTRLRKLTIIGSRIKSTRQLVRMLRGMLDVEMVDFRMNPCTLGWYLPLLVKDVPGALQPSDGDRLGADPGAGAQGATSSAVLGSRDEDRGRGRSGAKARGSSADGRAVSAAAPPGDGGSGRGGGAGVVGRGDAIAPGEGRGVGSRGSSITTWKDLDAKFRRDLPDEAYVGRLAYRGLAMRACPAVRLLDGVEVSAKERDKAEQLLKGVLGAARAKERDKDRDRGTGAPVQAQAPGTQS